MQSSMNSLNESLVLDKIWTILRKISELLANSTEFSKVTQNIVEIIAQGVNVDDCSMYQLDIQNNKLVLVASYGLQLKAKEKIEYDVDCGIIGQAFQLQQTYNIANHLQHPKFKLHEAIGESEFHSYLAVPLSWSGKNLGVLVLQTKTYNLFSDDVVDMMRSLAPQLANLILNAEIFKQTLAVDEVPDEAKEKVTFLKGMMVSPGVGAGTAYRLKTSANFSEIKEEKTENVDEELKIFALASENTKKEILQLEQCAVNLLTEVDASIFATHLLMLDDQLLTKHITDNIKESNFTLISSIQETYFFFERKFLSINDKMFRERLSDLKDILLRLLESAQRIVAERKGKKAEEGVPLQTRRDIVLVAEELLPSELMRVPIDAIRGILCEVGSSTSHVAILAKSLGIPALMGVKGVLKNVNENDRLIIDTLENMVFINPDEKIEENYRRALAAKNLTSNILANPAHIPIQPLPAILTDGYNVTLRANVSLLNEMAKLRESKAQGVGLYRSEFLFMMREVPPSEQDQFNVFLKLLSNTGDQPLTIRLLDVGADKPVPCLDLPKEENPALGCRGIRLLMQREEILIPHLRAVIRAAYHGRVRILVPMISSTEEVLEIRALIEDIKQKLRAQNINYGQNIELGVMLETPSLLFEMNRVLKEVDFISVGSNDLIQYLFAADRGNSSLERFTDPMTPTFFGVLKWISDLCKRNNVAFSICGELAGIPVAAPILVGLGYQELSMAPKRVIEIRNILGMLTTRECVDAASFACQNGRAKIKDYMLELLSRHGLSYHN